MPNKSEEGDNLNGIIKAPETKTGVSLVTAETKVQVANSIKEIEITEEEIERVLGDYRVTTRVYFVRHGITNEDEANKNKPEKERLPQSPEAKLTKAGEDQIRQAAIILGEMGLKKEDTLFIYSDDTTRVIKSLEIILGIFQLVGVVNDERLKSSEKDYSTGKAKFFKGRKRLLIDLGVTLETIKLMDDLIEKNEFKGFNNIILVGHKSNKPGIGESVANKNEVLGAHSDYKIQNGEIIESDIGKGTNDYIDYETENLLFVHSKNYTELKGMFPIKDDSIIDFQNKLNTYFRLNTVLYGTYLSGVHQELKVFCLANLITNQEYSIIENYYLTKCTNLSTEEKELFLQNTEDPKIQSILQKLFVCKEVFWNDNDSQMFKNHQQTPFYNVLKQSRTAYKNAQELQGKSLDPRIKLGGEKSILPRKFYYEEEEKEDVSKGNTREEREQKTKTLIQKDFLPEMFFRDSGYPKYIIRGNVGDGKSMYLSDLAKQYAQESGKMVKFASAKDFDGKEAEITIFFNNPGAILCIDALDEAKSETKMAIVNAFRAFQGHCIMTTRYSELIETGKDTRTLHFYLLDSDVYIDSRFSDDHTKATNVKEWLNTQGLATEVKGNPLLLNLIVLLAGATDTEMKWMKDYGILQYDQIKTKADLYDNVVRFVLAKHKEAIGNKTILDICMDRLSKHAFDIFSENKNPGIDQNFFDSHLSLLIGQPENKVYTFIHKSFYEFFLARHLAKMEKSQGSQEIYDYRDQKTLDNWGAWREFRPVVLFYGEILAKNQNWDELVAFLGEEGILKHDDMFGENFFMGLKLLYESEKTGKHKKLVKVSEKYEISINHWEKESVLHKFLLFLSFQEETNYGDNGHVDLYFRKMVDYYIYNKSWVTDYPFVCGLRNTLSINFFLDEVLKDTEMYLKDETTLGEWGRAAGIEFIGSRLAWVLEPLLKNGKASESIMIFLESYIKKISGTYMANMLEGLYIMLAKTLSFNKQYIVTDGAQKYINWQDFKTAGNIYLALIPTLGINAKEKVIFCIDKLMGIGKFETALFLAIDLYKSCNILKSESIYICYSKIQDPDYGGGLIDSFEVLIESGDNQALELAYQGSKILFENRSRCIGSIYIKFAQSNNENARQYALQCVENLLILEQYIYVVRIYFILDLIKDKYVVDKCILPFTKLLKGRHNESDHTEIFCLLAKSGYDYAISRVIEGAEKMLHIQEYEYSAFKIYEVLASSGQTFSFKPILNALNSCTKKEHTILKRYWLCDTLIDSGNESAIKLAIYWGRKLITFEECDAALSLCNTLAKKGKKEAVDAILSSIGPLEELYKKNITKSDKLIEEIYQAFALSGEKEAVMAADEYYTKHPMSDDTCLKLAPLGNKKAIQFIENNLRNIGTCNHTMPFSVVSNAKNLNIKFCADKK